MGPYGISESDAGNRIKSIRMRRVLTNEFTRRLADIKTKKGVVPQEQFHVVVSHVMKDAQVDGIDVPMNKVIQMLLPNVGEVLDCGYKREDLENWLDGKRSSTMFSAKQDGEMVFLGVHQPLAWKFKRRAEHDSTHLAYDISWRTLHSGGTSSGMGGGMGGGIGDASAAAAVADQLQDPNGKAATAAAIQSATQPWEKTLWCSVAERVRDDRRHMQYYPMSQEHVFDCLAQIMQAKEAFQLRTLIVGSADQVRGTHSLRVDHGAFKDVPQKNGAPDIDAMISSYPPITMLGESGNAEKHVIPFEAAQWRSQPEATNIAPSRPQEDAEALYTGTGLSQQRLDWLLSTDSLPSCLSLTSGDVIKGRPIEQNRGQIFVNSGFLVRHVALHAEMNAALSVIPGLRMVSAPPQASNETDAQMREREERIRNEVGLGAGGGAGGGGGADGADGMSGAGGAGGGGSLTAEQRKHIELQILQAENGNPCGVTVLSRDPIVALPPRATAMEVDQADQTDQMDQTDQTDQTDQVADAASIASKERLSRTVDTNRKRPRCEVAEHTSENPLIEKLKRIRTGLACCADHLVVERLKAELKKRPMSMTEKARWFLENSKFGTYECNLFDCASIFFSLKASEQLDVSNRLLLDVITRKFPDVYSSITDAADAIPEFTSRFAPANNENMLSFADGLVTFKGATRISKSNEMALEEKRKKRESGPEALAIVKQRHYAKTREVVTDLKELRRLAPLYLSKESVGRGNPLKRSELFKSVLNDKISAGLIKKNSPMVFELQDGAMIMARVRTRLAKNQALCDKATIESTVHAASYLRPIKPEDGTARGTGADLEEDLWGLFLEAECENANEDADAEDTEIDLDAGMLDDVGDEA